MADEVKTEVPATVDATNESNGAEVKAEPTEATTAKPVGEESVKPEPAAEGTEASVKPEPTVEDAAVATANGESKDETTAEPTKTAEEGDDQAKSSAHKRKAPQSGEEQDSKRSKQSENWTNQSKSKFDSLEESNDPDQIRNQVEFYFSDSNLPTDDFLLKKVGGQENKAVPLKLIHTFSRMRHFQPYTAVRDAVKDSKFLVLDENEEVKRKNPIDSKFSMDAQANRGLVHAQSVSRSIYAKGFGDETAETHLQIEKFFEPYGPVNSIRLRRMDDKTFKGSVFVEFGDEATQQRFLELDPKPQWEGKDLSIMSKQKYVDEKHQGILDGTVKPHGGDSRSFRGGRRGNFGHRDSRKRDGNDNDGDADNWKERRDRDRKEGGGRGRGRGRGRGGNRGGRGRGGRSRDDRDGERGQKRGREDDGGDANGEAKKAKQSDAPAAEASA